MVVDPLVGLALLLEQAHRAQVDFDPYLVAGQELRHPRQCIRKLLLLPKGVVNN